MERSERRATPLTIVFGTPVPLTSRAEEERYWCDSGDAGVHSLAWNARFCGFDCVRGDEDWIDVGWSCVGLRSGH